MDNKPNWTKKAGVTPGKLGLIGLLAAVLCGVLYLQYAPATKKTPANATLPAAPVEPAADSAKSTATADESQVAAAEPRKKTGALSIWQSPDLATVVHYDPFALPASFPQPRDLNDEAAVAQVAAKSEDASAQQAALEAERTKSESELQGMRQQGVHVIIKKKNEFVAMVGDQEVHVGDQINGFTVIAIDADGVRVAKDLGP